MPSHRYPFVRFQYADGSVDPWGHTCLPIRVINPVNKKSILTWGLVDTGADSTLFPATFATDLGHNLKADGVKSNITSGIEQTKVTTYKHTFKIELLSSDLKRTLWKSRKLEIDCIETNPPVLLGVSDFLCRFVVNLDYPSEQMTLRW